MLNQSEIEVGGIVHGTPIIVVNGVPFNDLARAEEFAVWQDVNGVRVRVETPHPGVMAFHGGPEMSIARSIQDAGLRRSEAC